MRNKNIPYATEQIAVLARYGLTRVPSMGMNELFERE